MFPNDAQAQDFNLPAPTDQESRTYQEGDVLHRGDTITGADEIHIFESPTYGTTNAVFGAGILLVLLIIFFFIKRGIENILIAGQVSPNRAVFTGWIFFLMMFCISLTALATFLALPPLWNFPEIFSSIVVVDVVAIVAFVSVYLSARRSVIIS